MPGLGRHGVSGSLLHIGEYAVAADRMPGPFTVDAPAPRASDAVAYPTNQRGGAVAGEGFRCRGGLHALMLLWFKLSSARRSGSS